MPDAKGETRRSRNARFNTESPEVEIEDIGLYLWEWFWDLDRGRQSGMNGPQPLAFADMQAWAAFSGNVLLPEEWAIIRDMDAAYLAAMADERSEAQTK